MAAIRPNWAAASAIAEAERNRALIAASPAEDVVDQDGKLWRLKRLPPVAEPVAALERQPVRAHTRRFSRAIA